MNDERAALPIYTCSRCGSRLGEHLSRQPAWFECPDGGQAPWSDFTAEPSTRPGLCGDEDLPMNISYPTCWEAKVVPVTHRTWRGSRLRQLAPTQAESVICDHVHRHHDTALNCARRLLKEVQP